MQTALGALSGAAGGYAQQEELKRKRMAEDTEFLLKYGDRFVEPGPLATRVPTGAPAPEAPKMAPPPSAIPMPTGPVDFGAATRQLEQEEARPSGTVAREVMGQTRFIPIGQRARDIARSQQIQEEEDAVQRAIRIAREQGKIQRESAEETFQVTNQRDFAVYQELGLAKKGEKYDPKKPYGTLIEEKGKRRGGAPAVNMVSLRTTLYKNLREDLGRDPTETEIDQAVSLIVPQTTAPAGGSRLSQGIAFARRLRDQGVSRDEAAKQVRAQFPDVADQLLGTPAAPAPLPTVRVRNEGFFGFPSQGQIGAASQARQAPQEDIQSLARKLSELNRGRFGTQAGRAEYAKNAAERARVQAAFNEAQLQRLRQEGRIR